MSWGSDAVAALLGELGLEFIALNPGASYRGLHDSLVNYLGNTQPQMILCLHEESAVAMAHGYAKVTERPMAVALHSNVGLMHGTMALFNAFCDRVPMLVLGAAGPVDASERRPWIDWIHSAADLGALIRNYCKWDDTPASVGAALESLMRADMLTRTYPKAPAYVCLDTALQEAPLDAPLSIPDPQRHGAPEPGAPPPGLVQRAAELILGAEQPLILVGRVGRGEESWAQRVALAESLGAHVLTDLKAGAGFPTAHPLHPAPPGHFLSAEGRRLLRGADVIVSLDWIDLAGTLQQAFGQEEVPSVISCTSDFVLHNGWSKDHFGLPPVDVGLSAHPDACVAALLDIVQPRAQGRKRDWQRPVVESSAPPAGDGERLMEALWSSLRSQLHGRSACLVRLPGWLGSSLKADHPLDFLGYDGGGGIGSGPGMAVGAALALHGDERLAVAVLGDGDYLMGATALWTAAHYELPLLVVVANNRSFFNDEAHQERIARMRDRAVENRWIGQHIRDPDPDIAGLARSLGLKAYGPVVDTTAELTAVLTQAAADAAAGATVVVDVHVTGHE
jgi:thiamine pyrophosphate-dependent acetolactate synthase large subunit-like protein